MNNSVDGRLDLGGYLAPSPWLAPDRARVRSITHLVQHDGVLLIVNQ